MPYVYLLQSIRFPDQRYVGLTHDFRHRLQEHNSGESPHTSRYRPWKPIVVMRSEDERRAAEFEQYLKSGSGRAFAQRHLW
jgi:predicted GIY-YIG superfamily endonuclease